MPLKVCGEIGSIIAAKVVEVVGTKIDIPRWKAAKKEIRERLGKSPDLADALALTFALDFGQSNGAKDSYEELLNELEERREYEQQQQQTAWDRFEQDIGERIFF